MISSVCCLWNSFYYSAYWAWEVADTHWEGEKTMKQKKISVNQVFSGGHFYVFCSTMIPVLIAKLSPRASSQDNLNFKVQWRWPQFQCKLKMNSIFKNLRELSQSQERLKLSQEKFNLFSSSNFGFGGGGG